MATIHRRQLRPRPLTAAAAQLLRFVRTTQQHPRTTAQIVEASGLRLGSAWNALIQLQERQLIRVDDAGHVVLTKTGAEGSGRSAA